MINKEPRQNENDEMDFDDIVEEFDTLDLDELHVPDMLDSPNLLDEDEDSIGCKKFYETLEQDFILSQDILDLGKEDFESMFITTDDDLEDDFNEGF